MPLVVAITTIAVDQDHMSTSTAAALVGAAIISTAMFPFVGTALRRGSPADRSAVEDAGAVQSAALGTVG